MPWSHGREAAAWMFPPFAIIHAVLDRLRASSAWAVLLLPAFLWAPWWPLLVSGDDGEPLWTIGSNISALTPEACVERVWRTRWLAQTPRGRLTEPHALLSCRCDLVH